MSSLLADKLNLQILHKICSGIGVEVNLRSLSTILRKHRQTIRKRVTDLIKAKIIDRPIFPFIDLFREYPVFVTAYADLPDDAKVVKWIKEDKHIFGAFKVREGDYNMMLFEFHTSLDDYLKWREQLILDGKIPERTLRIPSNVIYVPNRLTIKYDPSAAIQLIDAEYKTHSQLTMNGYTVDSLSLELLKMLVAGQGIRLNENLLARQLGYHRATITKRVKKLVEANIVLNPLCRFPAFFVPPEYLMIFSLIEVKDKKSKIENNFKQDSHVSLMYRVSQGRYNLLLFESHKTIEDYLSWEDEYLKRYPGCFGSIKNNYLSPKMTISIDQQKVSLGAIEERLQTL